MASLTEPVEQCRLKTVTYKCFQQTGLATNRLRDSVKLFYTGPVVNAEMLVTMLEQHGIAATQAFVDPPRRTTAI